MTRRTDASEALIRMADLGESSHVEAHGWLAPADVSGCKLHGVQLIQALGRRLRLRQRAVETAMVYFRRFYAVHTLLEHDLLLVAPTCVWCASKVEECALSAKLVVAELAELAQSAAGRDCSLPIASAGYAAADLFATEPVLLEALGFDLHVEHPHAALAELLHAARARQTLGADRSELVAQTAWMLLNDCHRADLCPQLPPRAVALAALAVSAELHALPVRRWVPEETLRAVDEGQVAGVAAALLRLFEGGAPRPAELAPVMAKLEAHWAARRAEAAADGYM